MDFFLHIFAQTWTWIDAPLVNVATQMSSRLFDYVRPNLKTISIIFLSFVVLSSLIHSKGEDLFARWLPALISIALFMTTFLTVPFYQKTIIYMWQHVPAGLIAAITGNPNQGNVPDLLDTSMIKSVLGATTILEGIATSIFNPQTWVVTILCAALIMCAVLAHIVMFFAFGSLDYLMALLVGVGPIALAFGVFEKTRGIAVAWLGCLATSAMATAMLVGTIVFITGTQGFIAQQVVQMKGGGAGAVGLQIVAMAVAASIYIMFGWLALQVKPTAEAIFNGVTGSVNNIIGAPVDAGIAVKNAVTDSGSTAPSSSGGSSASSSSTPPGRPLGRRP